MDLDEAIKSGGCSLCFDGNINLTFEHHNNQVYLFSPVMTIQERLSDDFFACLLQIQLFGVATNRCWFGYDAGGQRIMLFCLLDLDNTTPDHAIARIEALVDQVQYWQENLPQISQTTTGHSSEFLASDNFQRRKLK
ncbi:type III secretion system chaperone [Acerihabitans sp. TG2]|uniref:type III secretion system chaperone n=1 Tax=Acerihabitans sp. TG2 TaxID=3096008 RepID=UPI002B23EE36|nr:type III secretion system chaperone [Acerihabitans sp. TG2]MEA9391149.1 type III secretion system chaperone [Acerihabitans sp. TG2]